MHLHRFLRFFALASQKGLLSRMKATLDAHSDFLENIDGEDGIAVRRNHMGGVTIGGGGGAADIRSSPAMFTVTASLKPETTNTWSISTHPGTAQPLYGQVQIIPALDAAPAVIPDGGFAVVYATLLIYDQNVEDYVWEWAPTLSVTVAENAQDIHNKLPNVWHTKYQVIALISSSGEVSQGHEGAIVLPVPKSIVDLEPEEDPGT